MAIFTLIALSRVNPISSRLAVTDIVDTAGTQLEFAHLLIRIRPMATALMNFGAFFCVHYISVLHVYVFF